MAIWKIPCSLELINKRSENTLAQHLNIEFTDIGEDTLTATMPVDERTHQPIGIMHGGASCVLAETVGSTAANLMVDHDQQYCVGLNIFTNHIKSVREGLVAATSKPLHLGRSTQVWEIEIHNQKNQLISVTRLTMAVLNR